MAALSVLWSADARACIADCDGDGSVAINEIVTCVGIALGTESIETCPDCDGNDDGRVVISELIRAVGHALGTLTSSECAARSCQGSGGTISEGLCCLSADDFPDTCATGACGCAPQDSHEVALCQCGEGRCFDGVKCVTSSERACVESGGTVSTGMCCLATGDFPDTCAIGACSCAPQDSHEVAICDCSAEGCFDGLRCVFVPDARE